MLTNYVHRTTTDEAPATLPGPPPPPGGAPDQSPHHTAVNMFADLQDLSPRIFVLTKLDNSIFVIPSFWFPFHTTSRWVF